MKQKILYIALIAVILAAGIVAPILRHLSYALSFAYGILGLMSGGVMWLLYRTIFRTKAGELLVGTAVISVLAGAFMLVNMWLKFMRPNIMVMAVLGSLGVVTIFAAFAAEELIKKTSRFLFFAGGGTILAGVVGLLTTIELSFTVLCVTAVALMVWIPIALYKFNKRMEEGIFDVPKQKKEEREKKDKKIVVVKEKDVEIIDDAPAENGDGVPTETKEE